MTFSKLATRRNSCGVSLCCSCVRVRFPCRRRRRGVGRSTDRCCGLSRSIMRIPTRPVSTEASISVHRGALRCSLRWRESSRLREPCRRAGKPCRSRRRPATPPLSSIWARSGSSAERSSANARSWEPSARAACRTSRSRTSTSACAPRAILRGTSIRWRSCRRIRFSRPRTRRKLRPSPRSLPTPRGRTRRLRRRPTRRRRPSRSPPRRRLQRRAHRRRAWRTHRLCRRPSPRMSALTWSPQLRQSRSPAPRARSFTQCLLQGA
ncbi:MAG: hypothetical protein QOF27_624 [Gaiellaceae bacterium]|nr:hypothetical protein [Gaiellaceae bacterium]